MTLISGLCHAGPRWEGTEINTKGLVGKLMVELDFLPLTHLSSLGFGLLQTWDDFWGRPGCASPCWRNLAKPAKVLRPNFCGRKLNFALIHKKKVRKMLHKGNFSVLSSKSFFKYHLYKMPFKSWQFSLYEKLLCQFLLKMLTFCCDTSKSAPFWTCLAKDVYIQNVRHFSLQWKQVSISNLM